MSATDLSGNGSSKIKVTMMDETEHFKKVGATEKISGNQNPEYTKCISLGYFFHKPQLLRFEIKEEKTSLGMVDTSLAQLMMLNAPSV